MPRAPKFEQAERTRLTVLVGAGASLYAGAPSTQSLTTTLRERPLTGAIITELQKNDESNDAHFEDALYVLEELEHLRDGTERSARMLRAFVDRSAALIAIGASDREVRIERLAIHEAIAGAFSAVDYNSAWPELATLVEPFLRLFDVDLFTLNYDLLLDVAVNALVQKTGIQYFDGFGRPIYPDGTETFRPDQFALWPDPVHLTLAHLHGSLNFAYHPDDERMAYAAPLSIAQAATPAAAQETWRGVRLAVEADERLSLGGVSPIIAGLRKAEKLLLSPYANYYAAFSNRISSSPNLLVVGYGSGDAHINFWLREFGIIHGQRARMVEITKDTAPHDFATQRYGAYDFVWNAVGDELYHSSAGIECLVFNGGFPYHGMPTDRLVQFLSGSGQRQGQVS